MVEAGLGDAGDMTTESSDVIVFPPSSTGLAWALD